MGLIVVLFCIIPLFYRFYLRKLLKSNTVTLNVSKISLFIFSDLCYGISI